ncbi:MAG TPA: hypothetical protein VFF19_15065 [Reyranella sp.]|nr:hypothetical protein [Reyranella sp.]
MAKTSSGKSVTPAAKSPEGVANLTRDGRTGRLGVGEERFKAVMQAARQAGLLHGKGGRIGGRVSPVLIRQAKRQTGIEADTDLIEFALATVALEDNFAQAFRKSRGKVDPKLRLGNADPEKKTKTL